MQVSLVVCLLAALVCTGCVDAHVEKLFGIINRLMNEREVSRTSCFLGVFLSFRGATDTPDLNYW